MSIRPIITFKAGICEVDVSLPYFIYGIGTRAMQHTDMQNSNPASHTR